MQFQKAFLLLWVWIFWGVLRFGVFFLLFCLFCLSAVLLAQNQAVQSKPYLLYFCLFLLFSAFTNKRKGGKAMEALTCSCNTILSHSPVDPWHKFYTAAGIYTLNITICIACSVLIMLITCLTLCCEKWLYLAVHCLPIQLTVWLKCTFRRLWMARFFHVAGFIQTTEKFIQVNWFRSATKKLREKSECVPALTF